MDENPAASHPLDRKADERKAFLFLTVVTWPAIAFLVVATYGLVVWIYQMFAGPPGPMH
jgi:nitrate reductase NapE